MSDDGRHGAHKYKYRHSYLLRLLLELNIQRIEGNDSGLQNTGRRFEEIIGRA